MLKPAVQTTVCAKVPGRLASTALDDGTHSVDVTCGTGVNLAKIAEESKVQVTGICIMEAEAWRPNSIIPKITDISVVVSNAEDVTVVEGPPWLTPARLIYAIIALTAVLLAIMAWNITLRTLVARRSRQLLKSEIAKADAQLRISERTRLAAELHDSVAQDLSGVSLQIDAAARLVDGDRDRLAKRLELASIALKSCRVELRNCLWELRNQALDEPDMKSAIEHSLSPYISDAHLAVRFDVRRSAISDNTAHALLSVIRELVTNALRHGEASQVKVSGSLGKNGLSCTVEDNGRGFDPGSCPGVAQGHFGLTGIRERLGPLHAKMEISSRPGKGTTVTISIPSTPKTDNSEWKTKSKF